MRRRASLNSKQTPFDPLPRLVAHQRRENQRTAVSDAERVVLWLNAARGTASYRRVLSIHARLADLSECCRQYRASDAEYGLAHRHKQWAIMREQGTMMGALESRISPMATGLNQALFRYKITPQTQFNSLSVRWNIFMVSRTTRNEFLLPYGNRTYKLQLGEADAVLSLLRLAQSGDFQHVRLCAWCQEKWRVSYRKMDRFCSDKCRIAAHTSTPDAQEQHVKAQQKYRKTDGFKRRQQRDRVAQKVLASLGKSGHSTK